MGIFESLKCYFLKFSILILKIWNIEFFNLNFWNIELLNLKFWIFLIIWNSNFWNIELLNLKFWFFLIIWNLKFWNIEVLNLKFWIFLIFNYYNCESWILNLSVSKNVRYMKSWEHDIDVFDACFDDTIYFLVFLVEVFQNHENK